jgi:hypothetical protein
MVLLIAIPQEAQLSLGAGQVILDTATDPIIVRVRGDAVVHDLGDYFECLGEGFHLPVSSTRDGITILTDSQWGQRLHRSPGSMRPNNSLPGNSTSHFRQNHVAALATSSLLL